MNKVTGTLLAFATAALVVLVFLWQADELVSPGSLHPTHRDVPELSGADGCTSCHGDATRDLVAACTECHAAIGAQLARDAGLHGRLAARACGTCHVEHSGDQVPLVGQHAFARAGIDDRDRYDHRHAPGFALGGAHRALACRACHEHADAVRLPRGESRFLGLTQACSACHDDPHHGELGADCARCHGQTAPFAVVAEFAHDPRFPLAGAHGEATCRDCHEPATLRGPERDTSVRPCSACHDSPHRPELTETADCRACHESGDPSFRRPHAEIDGARHAAAGFALVPPHAGMACSSCHAGIGEAVPFDRKFPGRAADDCAACHEDPHAGQFGGGARCTACHAHERFAPTTFGVAQHAATAFPLTGAHDAVACASCHEIEEASRTRSFAGTPTTCAACHRDPHGGRFDLPNRRSDCSRCHTTTHFGDVAWQADEHARWTGFALRGAHHDASCAACHGRPFAAAPRACAACHEDVHAGQFAAGGRTDCARCHRDGHAFTDLVFDHARHTRFPLDATHAALACNTCHRAAETRSGASVVRYRPLGTECADCHLPSAGGRR